MKGSYEVSRMNESFLRQFGTTTGARNTSHPERSEGPGRVGGSANAG